jgi:hypothetical protein
MKSIRILIVVTWMGLVSGLGVLPLRSQVVT